MTPLRRDPGAGDPSLLREMSRDRRARAEAVVALSREIGDAVEQASGPAWTGRARDAFSASVATTLPHLDLLSTNLHATADVLDVYAETIALIKHEQHDVERRRFRLHEERDELLHRSRVLSADLPAPALLDLTPSAEAVHDDLRRIDALLSEAQEEWEALIVRRERADDDCASALRSREVRGALFDVLQARRRDAAPIQLLARLSNLSAADLAAFAAAHTDLFDHIQTARPHEIADWWTRLGDRPDQRDLLTAQLPSLIGGLGGLPASVRVAANRLVARARLATLRRQLGDERRRGYRSTSAQPYAVEAAAAAHLARVRTLQTEIGYLERVARGDVTLYLYAPQDGRIIEIFGDPHKAEVLLTVMPGTNTTMDSFYTATERDGITALARWQAGHPAPGVTVASLVVKQGEFPRLDDAWSRGPQHNWFARPLGRAYAGLVTELDTITGDTPIVSLEHSFGSAPAGDAETRGAHFAARFLLAGIGMTEGWTAHAGTEYYTAQGPLDINRALDDVQAGDIGYAITPSEIPGVTEIDTGYTDGMWGPIIAPQMPLIGVPATLAAALDQHNRLLSADPEENNPVLSALRRLLASAAGR